MSPTKDLFIFVTNIMLVAFVTFGPCFYLTIRVLGYFNPGHNPIGGSGTWAVVTGVVFVILLATNLWLRRHRPTLSGVRTEWVCTHCGHRIEISHDTTVDQKDPEHCPKCHNLMVITRTPIAEVPAKKQDLRS